MLWQDENFFTKRGRLGDHRQKRNCQGPRNASVNGTAWCERINVKVRGSPSIRTPLFTSWSAALRQPRYVPPNTAQWYLKPAGRGERKANKRSHGSWRTWRGRQTNGANETQKVTSRRKGNNVGSSQSVKEKNKRTLATSKIGTGREQKKTPLSGTLCTSP